MSNKREKLEIKISNNYIKLYNISSELKHKILSFINHKGFNEDLGAITIFADTHNMFMTLIMLSHSYKLIIV